MFLLEIAWNWLSVQCLKSTVRLVHLAITIVSKAVPLAQGCWLYVFTGDSGEYRKLIISSYC